MQKGESKKSSVMRSRAHSVFCAVSVLSVSLSLCVYGDFLPGGSALTCDAKMSVYGILRYSAGIMVAIVVSATILNEVHWFWNEWTCEAHEWDTHYARYSHETCTDDSERSRLGHATICHNAGEHIAMSSLWHATKKWSGRWGLQGLFKGMGDSFLTMILIAILFGGFLVFWCGGQRIQREVKIASAPVLAQTMRHNTHED